MIRRSLDLRSWEAAVKLIREWEVEGDTEIITVQASLDRWLADCAARQLKPQSIKKYREIKKELIGKWSGPVRAISVDDVRKLRESWKYSSSTVGKRLELIRSFFSFCLTSGWIEKNPAKGVKAPPSRQVPTLPFSDNQWKDILMALDMYGEIHPQSPVRIRKQLKALILLMRYSGLRISDAVGMCAMKIDSSGNMFIYMAKTGVPVKIPLPPVVLEALWEIYVDEDISFFWSGNGKLKTALTEWQERLKKVFRIAGIPSGHGHRLRDTFAVELLQRGVDIQTVSILLGHRSIKTTEKSYSPWVKSRQDALDDAIKKTWVIS